MHDLSRGQERLRRWPQPRGRGRSPTTKEQNDTFRQAIWAAKLTPAAIQADVRDAVKDTPLLPFDLLVSNLYGRLFSLTLHDGRKLYPMATRIEVSQSLDALAQLVGSLLFRGADFWEAVPIGEPGQALIVGADGTHYDWAQPSVITDWQTIASWSAAADGPTAALVTPDLTGFSRAEIIFDAVGSGVSGTRTVDFSVDGGDTYDSSASYLLMANTGLPSATETGIFSHATATTAARRSVIQVLDMSHSGLKPCSCLRGPYYYTNPAPITNIRARTSGAGATMTSGSVQIRVQ